MHSRSPLLHDYWLAKYGLTGAYVPLAIKPAGLHAALRALPALGFAGCNLTIPHKEAALDIVDRVDPVARRIGAMNCVVVAPDGSLDGYNHDAFGYVESMREAQPGWRADAGPDRGDRRRRRCARRRGRPDRSGRARHPAGEPHAGARAGAAARVRRPGPGDGLGRPRRARSNGAAMLINTTNQGMAASRRSNLRSIPCPRARSSPTSSISRARRRCWRPPARAATRPSTASAC